MEYTVYGLVLRACEWGLGIRIPVRAPTTWFISVFAPALRRHEYVEAYYGSTSMLKRITDGY